MAYCTCDTTTKTRAKQPSYSTAVTKTPPTARIYVRRCMRACMCVYTYVDACVRACVRLRLLIRAFAGFLIDRQYAFGRSNVWNASARCVGELSGCTI